MSESLMLTVALILLGLNLLLLIVLLLRKPDDHVQREAMESLRNTLEDSIDDGNERLERELRRELTETARTSRQEHTQTLGTFQNALVQHAAESARTQAVQLDGFAQQLARMERIVQDTLNQRLASLHEGNQQRMNEVRQTLDEQITRLAQGNTQQLEQVRTLVGENRISPITALPRISIEVKREVSRYPS